MAKKKEPIGRPTTPPEMFDKWLEELRPFLRQGHSLWYAIEKVGLQSHMKVIYQKYRDDEDFRKKIDRLQATISELNNSIIFKVIERNHARLAESDKVAIDREDAGIIKLVAEKHRTSQTHWVTRTETAEAKDKDFGKVVEVPVIEYTIPKESKAPKDEAPKPTQAADPVSANAETAPSVANPSQ